MQHEKARSAAIDALADAGISTQNDWFYAHASTKLTVVRKTVAALTPAEIWTHLEATPRWLDDFADLVSDTFVKDEILRLMAYGTLGHVFRHGIESLADDLVEDALRELMGAAA